MINNKKNISLFFTSLFVILFALFLVYIKVGPVPISIMQIVDVLFSGLFNIDSVSTRIHEMVILNIRIPRLILAFLVGGGLGLSGAILQGLFRNPLIDPGFIGVSSGAAVGAMIAIMFSNIFYLYLGSVVSSFLLPFLSILGSFITTFIIYRISIFSNKTNIMTMLLAGIAINALAGSIIGLLVSFSSDAELRTFTFWTLGGLDAADWDIVLVVFIFVFFAFSIVYSIRNKLDIFMLGDYQATHLGVDVEKLKRIIILFSSTIVGVSVAFCGMIGFIGLVTPHLVRLFIGPKHAYLIPGSALLGAILLIVSDLISKIVIAPAQLPVGVVTSLIGAPFFIFLIMKQKTKIGYAE